MRAAPLPALALAAVVYFLQALLRAIPLLPPTTPPSLRFAALLTLPPLLALPLVPRLACLLPALAWLLALLVAVRHAAHLPHHLPSPYVLFARLDVAAYLSVCAAVFAASPTAPSVLRPAAAALAPVVALAYVLAAFQRLRAPRQPGMHALLRTLFPPLPVDLDAARLAPPTPRTTSAIAMLSFAWMNRTVSTGRARPLEADDVLPLRPCFVSNQVAHARFAPIWRQEVATAGRQHAVLFRALFKAFGARLMLGGLLKVWNDVCVFVSPMLLRLIIRHLQERDTDTDYPIRGFLLAVALFVTYATQSLVFCQYFNIICTVQIQLRAALVSAVFEKSCRLSPESRGLYTAGQIQNLMSTDARTLSDVVLYIHMLWSSLEQVIVAMFLLVNLLGWIPTVAGVSVILATIPLQAYLVGTIKALREKASSRTDDRVKIVSEAIKGIKLVKLYAWELSFVKRILAARAKELEYLRKMALTQACSTINVSSLPTTLTIVAFMAYSATGRVLNAAVVFPAIALFNVIRPPLLIFPSTIVNAARAAASLSRLRKFLTAEELVPINKGEHAFDQDVLRASKIDLAADRAAFAWDPSISFSAPTLSSVSFQAPEGSLIAVVGPTGGGKSTLLAGMLGEVPILSGRAGMREGRTVSYCDQIPFIQNATVRDNILFGKPFNGKRYRQTVKACSLLSDFRILPAGDLTEIGGRGVNLSGGQRARVSLARAVYSDADICLLDDPLCAVDAHVGKSIFNNCIVGSLRGKTRMLTTNQVHFAASPEVDLIIVVSSGTIIEFGKRADLLANPDSEFAKLVAASGASGAGDVPNEHIEDVEELNSVADKGDDVQPMESIGGYKMEKDGKESPQLGTKPALDKATAHLLDGDGIASYGAIEAGKLTRKETKNKGRVRTEHYLTYLRAMGLFQWAFPIFLFASLAQVASLSVNVWLSMWSEESTNRSPGDPNTTASRLIVFSILGVATFVIAGGSAFSLAFGTIRASVLLHEKLLLSVFGAPSSFFSSTPEGRLVNRFNSDMDKIDSTLGPTMQSLGRMALNLAFTFGLILWATPAFIFVAVPVALLCLYIQEFYRKSSVDLRRLEALSRSPLYSHFGETLDGVMTIRAYGNVPKASHANDLHTDQLNKMTYACAAANRWIQVRLESLGTILIFGATLLATFAPPGQLSASMSGLVLSYVMQILGSLTWSVRQFTESESQMSAVERVSEYSGPPFRQEEVGGLEGLLKEQQDSASQGDISSDSKGLISEEKLRQLSQGMRHRRSRWPKKGNIVFDNVEMRYRKDLAPALRSVSFVAEPGEHIGIVGRTGAGKSSAIQCLFRLYELEKGSILIDGVDISDLRLFNLRSSLGIIPQEPFCFSGTIRSNLDMFGEHDDKSIQNALDSCGLQETMKDKVDLDYVVQESGANLSVGQRQLLCLGRALLRDSQVLVLDEATSNVSNETDEKIQQTLRNEMGHCTILTVAHRLHTVMKSDRIIVMDAGRIAEIGKPSELLSGPSKLSDLVDETGPSTAAHLRYLASHPRETPSRKGLSSRLSAIDSSAHGKSLPDGTRAMYGHVNESALGRVRNAFTELRSALLEAHSEVWGEELASANMEPEQWKDQLKRMVSKLNVLSKGLACESMNDLNGGVQAFVAELPNGSTDMIGEIVQEASPTAGMPPRAARDSTENLPRRCLRPGANHTV